MPANSSGGAPTPKPIDQAVDLAKRDVADILAREDLVRAGLPIDPFDTQEVDLAPLVDPFTTTPAVRHWREQSKTARDLLRRAEIVLLHKDRTGIKQAWIKRLLDSATVLEAAWDDAVREIVSASQGRLDEEIRAQSKAHRKAARQARIDKVVGTVTQVTSTTVSVGRKTFVTIPTSIVERASELGQSVRSGIDEAKTKTTQGYREIIERGEDTVDELRERLPLRRSESPESATVDEQPDEQAKLTRRQRRIQQRRDKLLREYAERERSITGE